MANQFDLLVFDRIAPFYDTLTLEQEDVEFDTQSIQVIFVLHLKKTLYDKFFNGVRVACTILNSLEKESNSLASTVIRKKLIVNI